jgi:hypothetical protein
MGARTVVAVVATALALVTVPPSAALGQEDAPSGPPTVSPTSSPSTGGRPAGRDRSPGFVLLLVLLALGLVWQVQRARRTTDRISARSLDELERALQPDDPPPRRQE